MKTNQKSSKKKQQMGQPKGKSKCQVCLQINPKQERQGHEMLECFSCKKKVHRYCYVPDFKFSKNDDKFKCDVCLKKKKENAFCWVCKRNDGILKSINEEKQNKFIHVLCALTSQLIVVNSYKKLEFKIKKDKHNGIQDKNNLKKCSICKKILDHSSLLKCFKKDCQNHAHYQCVMSMNQDDKKWCVLFDLLDKNKYFMKNILKLSQRQDFKYFQELKPLQIQINYLSCPSHSHQQDFVFCYCGKQRQPSFYGCDFCGRWFHKECTTLTNQKQDFKCPGCINKNIYLMRMALPLLIQQMVKLEKEKDKLSSNPAKLKFIDAFPFQLSKITQEMISMDGSKMTIYYLCQYILQLIKQYPQIMDNLQNCRRILIDKNIIKVIKIFNQDKGQLPNGKNQLFINKLILEITQINQQKKYDNVIKVLKMYQQYTNIIQMELFMKNKIEQFTKSSKKLNFSKNCSYLTDQLFEISDYYQQLNLVNYQSKQQKNNNKFQISRLLVTNNLSKFQIQILLDKYNKIKLKTQFSEEQYYQIINSVNLYPQKLWQTLYQFFMKRINKIYRLCIYYQQFIQNCFKKINKKQWSSKQLNNLKKIVCEEDIYLPKNEIFTQVFNNELKQQIIKKKCFKKLSQPQSLKNTQLLILEITKVLKNKNLSVQQKYIFQRYKIKSSFYTQILRKFNSLKSQLKQSESSGNSEIQMDIEINQEDILAERVFNILEDSLAFQLEIDFVICQMNKLAESQIQFTERQIKTLRIFCQKVFSRINQSSMDDNPILTSWTLKKVISILKYLNLNQLLRDYQRQYNSYIEWKKKLEQYKDIKYCLQKDLKTVQVLLDILNQMVSNQKYFNIKLNQEIQKIKIIKLWANISKKYFQNFVTTRKNKPTISAVGQFKDILIAAKYPKNDIYNRIIQLDRQAKQINQKISKFLSKSKQQDLQIQQQIQLYKKKITIQESQNLLIIMKNSNLDVDAQIKQLEFEIKEYKRYFIDIPTNFENISKMSQLLQLKKKILQCPLRGQSSQLYYQLIKTIYKLKIQQFQNSITRKQFINMQIYGGIIFLNFLEKQNIFKLYTIYKQLEKAQKQLSFGKNRNQKYLLQINEQQSIKIGLELDHTQWQNVQKWFINYRKLRQKIKQLKYKRQNLQAIQNIQLQFYKIPINAKESFDQLTKMKRQLEIINSQIKSKISQRQPLKVYQLILKRSSQFQDLLKRYKLIGIKHPDLQKYCQVIQIYKQISKISQKSSENYIEFSQKCHHYPEFKDVQQIIKIRSEYFDRVYKSILQGRQSIQLSRTLIRQGCDIFKYSPHYQDQDKYMNCLLSLNSRLGKATKQLEIDDQDDSNMNQSQDGEDDDDMDQDMDDQEDYQSEASIKKRKRQEPEIVQVDLDDDS